VPFHRSKREGNTIRLESCRGRKPSVYVDSKDIGAGMSCPPTSFVSCTYLQTLYTLLQPHHGILAIDVAAQDRKLFQQTCEAVQSVSPLYSCQKANVDSSYNGDGINVEPEDLNVVVFAVCTIIESATQ
jgi:hypothetical protein